MKICLRLYQLLAIYSNTNENWDYHETSLKVADIFDKRDEMKKDLDRVNAKDAVFAENFKAKFSSVTMLTGILVTCIILISSIVRNL